MKKFLFLILFPISLLAQDTTKWVVPRVDGEGQIGASSKHWRSTHVDSLFADYILTGDTTTLNNLRQYLIDNLELKLDTAKQFRWRFGDDAEDSLRFAQGDDILLSKTGYVLTMANDTTRTHNLREAIKDSLGKKKDASDSTNGTGFKTVSSISRQFLAVRKSADEKVYNSDVLQNDNHLTLPAEANSTYIIEMCLIMGDSSVSADSAGINIQLTGPSGATCMGALVSDYFDETFMNYSVAWDILAEPTGEIWVMYGMIDYRYSLGDFIYHGTITTAGTAGDITLTWAQLIAHLECTAVLLGSYMTLQKQ